jgi:hypothetical protein
MIWESISPAVNSLSWQTPHIKIACYTPLPLGSFTVLLNFDTEPKKPYINPIPDDRSPKEISKPPWRTRTGSLPSPCCCSWWPRSPPRCRSAPWTCCRSCRDQSPWRHSGRSAARPTSSRCSSARPRPAGRARGHRTAGGWTGRGPASTRTRRGWSSTITADPSTAAARSISRYGSDIFPCSFLQFAPPRNKKIHCCAASSSLRFVE